MKPINTAILVATAALVFTASVPAEATWYSNNRGYWGGSSGWGASGWGSSDWGSPGYGIYTKSASSTVGSSSSPGSNGTGGVGNDPSLGGTAVPEPSNLLMLGLGVAGLIAGRLVARRRKSK